jgi:rare lipoprotein A
MGTRVGGGHFRRIARIGAIVGGCFALAACSSARMASNSEYSPKVIADGEPVPKGGGAFRVGQPYTINGHTYYPNDNHSYRAEGIASWYGPDFHGRLTANGEIFDMHAISAAHPTMPLPSYARVTNLDNGRSIIVRVNDRGPYARNRIIDVSIGTAKALAFYGDGLARVRVEYVGRAPIDGSDDHALLATLREGRPAPVSPQLMIASTEPFIPTPGVYELPPIPAERPFALGSPADRVADRSNGASMASASPPVRSVARSPAPKGPPPADRDWTQREPDAVAAFVPVQREPALGLMSGRGLY